MEDIITPIFSVSQFIEVSNQVFETAMPIVKIEGEVSSFKVNQGKFVFFELKDGTGSVSCFMMVFALRIAIEDGMKIIVSARPKLTNWGKFSLTIISAAPSGEGNLKRSADLLREKLQKEGVFDESRKRRLPVMPQRIGVIASPESAGFTDFSKIIDNRWAGLQVAVARVQVQGESAPDQIIRALRYFNEQANPVEVVVLIRGGGSAQDLSGFNDEALVRAVASSRIPTLVGVGHEIDTSLADLAADRRAATPSNAAEIIVPDKVVVIARNRQLIASLPRQVKHRISLLYRHTDMLLQAGYSSLSDVHDDNLNDLRRLMGQLSTLDPAAVMRRGYALIRGSVTIGGAIVIETNIKMITAEITDVKQK